MRLYIIVFVFIVLAGCGSGQAREISPKHIFSLLPENTDFVLISHSIGSAYKSLGIAQDKILGKKITAYNIQDMVKEIGFNLLDEKALESNGVDLKREIGLGMSGFSLNPQDDSPQFSLYLFIPVANKLKAFDALKNIVKKISNSNIKVEINQEELRLTERDFFFEAFFKQDYFFLNFKRGEEVLALSKVMRENKNPLRDKPSFQNVLARVKAGDDFFAYASIAGFLEPVLPLILKNTQDIVPGFAKIMEAIKEYKVLGLSLNMSTGNLILDTAVEFANNSQFLEIMDNKNLDRQGIESIFAPPAFFASSYIDPAKYFRYLTKLFGDQVLVEMDEGLAEFKSETGVDLVKDILENLQGSFHFGVFDGKSINMLNYNMVLAFRVKEEKKAWMVLEKLLEKAGAEARQYIQKQADGAYVFNLISKGMGQFYFNIKDNVAFLTQNREYYKSIMQGEKGMLYKRLPDKEVRKVLESNQHVLYLNVDEIYAAVKNFAGIINMSSQQSLINAETDRVVGMFEYILNNGRVEENWAVGSFVVKTRLGKPFLPGVIDLFNPEDSW